MNVESTVKVHGRWRTIIWIIFAIVVIQMLVVFYLTDLWTSLPLVVAGSIIAPCIVVALFLQVGARVKLTPSEVTIALIPFGPRTRLDLSTLKDFSITTNEDIDLMMGFGWRRGRNGRAYSVGAPWIEFERDNGKKVIASLDPAKVSAFEAALGGRLTQIPSEYDAEPRQ